MPRDWSRKLKRWFVARSAAKFIRASMPPLENQPGPSSQPLTSGGSKSCWPMLMSGLSALFTENPFQPTSFNDRATNSTGQEYRL